MDRDVHQTGRAFPKAFCQQLDAGVVFMFAVAVAGASSNHDHGFLPTSAQKAVAPSVQGAEKGKIFHRTRE